jgi:endoglucanase
MRNTDRIMMAVVSLCGGCAVSTAEPLADDSAVEAAEPIRVNQYYEVVALHSGKCVDVANASVAHAASVVQGTCWRGGNQKWRLQDAGNGYYDIIVQHSGKCLDVANASLAHAAPVVQGNCWGGANQRWRLNEVGTSGGYPFYEVLAQHSGKCLDVENASLSHAAPIVQADCWGGANQRFIFRPVPP